MGQAMKLAETVTFGGSGLDRAALLRRQPKELDRLAAMPGAGLVPLWRGRPLTRDRAALAWLPMDHPELAATGPAIFLGLDDGSPRFAADLSDWEPEDPPETPVALLDRSQKQHPGMPERTAFVELRAAMAALSPRDAELAAMAKALLGWHANHTFCARCGSGTEMAEGGWQRHCPDCGTHHFPRADPVVIMLVTLGNEVLIGRSPGWPEGMYSLLAGYVEPGETIEAAVRRETLEEAGIRVGRVSYLASQPWPYPSSLMIGCHGEALSREISIDPVEIEDATWVTREEMAEAISGNHPRLAPARRGAIAHFLLKHWLSDRLD